MCRNIYYRILVFYRIIYYLIYFPENITTLLKHLLDVHAWIYVYNIYHTVISIADKSYLERAKYCRKHRDL